MFNIVASIYILMALGWAFKKYGLMSDGAEKAFNQYLFYLALPALTLVKIADTSFAGLGFDFIALNLLPILAVMLFAYAGWKAGMFDWPFARLLIIVGGLGNTIYLGFPVVSMSLGPENIGYAAIAASLQNVFIFTFGFFFMGTVCGRDCPAVNFRKMVLKNAMLWSSLAGLCISYSGLKIPEFIHNLLTDIGRTTLPLSLFTMGLSLYGKSLRRHLDKVAWVAGLKMVYMPAVFVGLALLFGFKGTVSKVTFLQLAMPVAVLNYVIAREFEFDPDLISQSIVFSTLLLLPLMFVFDLVMKVFL